MRNFADHSPDGWCIFKLYCSLQLRQTQASQGLTLGFWLADSAPHQLHLDYFFFHIPSFPEGCVSVSGVAHESPAGLKDLGNYFPSFGCDNLGRLQHAQAFNGCLDYIVGISRTQAFRQNVDDSG
jgi:hypothetical protein